MAGSRRARRGFTLMEVILAVTLTVGMMLAAMGFYQQVVDVREDFGRQLGAVQATAARRLVMDRITREFRSAISYSFLQVGLSGEPMEIRFMTTALPGPAAWAVEDMTEDPIPPEHDIRMVGYSLRYGEDEDGFEIIEGLQRSEQKIISSQEAEEGEEIRSTLIAPEFKFISFRFWDAEAQEWMETWESGGLPVAVEVVLGLDPLPEDLLPEEYPYETFRRVIYLPGAEQSGSGAETIIRGMGGGR